MGRGQGGRGGAREGRAGPGRAGRGPIGQGLGGEGPERAGPRKAAEGGGMGGRGRGGAREGMEGGAWAGPGRAGPGLDPPLPTWLMLGCPCFFLEAVSRPQREEKRLRRLLVERDMACVRRLTPVSAVRAATCGRGQRGGVRGRPSPRTHHRTLPRQRSSPQPAPPLPPGAHGPGTRPTLDPSVHGRWATRPCPTHRSGHGTVTDHGPRLSQTPGQAGPRAPGHTGHTPRFPRTRTPRSGSFQTDANAGSAQTPERRAGARESIPSAPLPPVSTNHLLGHLTTVPSSTPARQRPRGASPWAVTSLRGEAAGLRPRTRRGSPDPPPPAQGGGRSRGAGGPRQPALVQAQGRTLKAVFCFF